MAEYSTLARPYARAAFDLALQKSQLNTWADFLSLTSALVLDTKVNTLLNSPSLSSANKAKMLLGVLDDVSSDGVNFIGLMAENKRLLLLPAVCEGFLEHKANYEKTLDVTLVSAYPAEANQLAALKQALTQKLARQVSLVAEVDKSLLGGAIIRAGDTVIDGSVRGQLNKLAVAMNA